MKYILVFIFILNITLFASNINYESKEKKLRVERQIKKEIEKEKKYAKEQTFYQSKNYDLSGAEVNLDSLSTLPEINVDDLDMDSVYD